MIRHLIFMKETISKTYNKKNSVFKDMNLVDNNYTDLIKEHTNKDSIVLDIGCGGGRLTKSIAPHVKKIYGIDYSKELIKSAKKSKLSNITYKTMDGEKLDFNKNTFDVVISQAVINKDMCKAKPTLKSIKKVLKPNGKIVIKMIYSSWGKEFKFKSGYNKKEITNILKKLNFRNIQVRIDKIMYNGKSKDDLLWLYDTEAIDLSPKGELDKYIEKCKEKKKFTFDDSMMIVYAQK